MVKDSGLWCDLFDLRLYIPGQVKKLDPNYVMDDDSSMNMIKIGFFCPPILTYSSTEVNLQFTVSVLLSWMSIWSKTQGKKA
jgi:hypothetical protein